MRQGRAQKASRAREFLLRHILPDPAFTHKFTNQQLQSTPKFYILPLHIQCKYTHSVYTHIHTLRYTDSNEQSTNMPRVNIYIRQEDWDTWQLIPDKPQWLRARLGEIDEPPMPRVRAYDKKPLNKASKDYSLCPHGSIKGFCKKGCR